MIKRFFLLSGIYMALSISVVPVSAASIYEQIREQLEFELFTDEKLEPVVKEHIEIISTPEKDISRVKNSIAWLRGTMRALQIAASSEESSISLYENTNDAGALFMRMLSLINIWKSDATVSPMPLGNNPLEFAQYKDIDAIPFNELKEEITKLIVINDDEENREKFDAAVWRYRNGFTDFEEECENDGLGDGTELQYLTARFCAVEEKMNEILKKIKEDLDLNKTNKVTLFPVYQFKDLNVNVWVRSDNVGLSWSNHLSPILPSLDCRLDKSFNQDAEECIIPTADNPEIDGAILGGKYPPEPPELDGFEGYCSHPLAKRGYLCRPHEKTICQESNVQSSQQMGGEIVLAKCTSPMLETPLRITLSGMDICKEGGWLLSSGFPSEETANRDDDLSATKHQNCYVDFVCGNCPGGTSLKEESGRIEVCLDQDYEPLSAYFAIRELVHANQQCNLTPNGEWTKTYETRNGCCAMETQANIAACNAMAEDGILAPLNITVSSCAIALSNNRCEEVIGSGGLPPNAPEGAGVCGDNGIGKNSQDVLEEIKTYVEKNIENFKTAHTCEEVITSPDERITMLRESLSLVCSPEYEAKYKNTIGNALCHIGQCVEQSVEEQKITPGRITWNVQDEAFPWESDMKKREDQESHIQKSTGASFIPAYRPLELMRKMEDELCQAKGMPRRSVPSLCSYDAKRRLNLPSKTHGIFAVDGATQANREDDEHARLLSLLPSIGARTGTDLFVQYFEPAVLSLEKILQGINTMLVSLEETRFPENMCPRINE